MPAASRCCATATRALWCSASKSCCPTARCGTGCAACARTIPATTLKQLFIGGEGTLGIITAATLKPFPDAESEIETAFLGLTRVEDAMALFARAREASGDQLTAFELIPRIGIDIALKHVPGIVDPLPTIFPWYVLLEVSSSEAQSGLARGARAVSRRQRWKPA